MIECRQCGTDNHFDGAAFCRNCGSELKASVAVQVEESAEERPSAEAKSTAEMPGQTAVDPEEQLQAEVSELPEREGNPRREEGESGGIENLLKRYEKESNASNLSRDESPETRPAKSSLDIVTAADYLMREQQEDPTSKLLPSSLGVSPSAAEPQIHEDGGLEKRAIDLSSSDQGSPPPVPDQSGTISTQDKEMLLKSLEKSITPSETNKQPGSPTGWGGSDQTSPGAEGSETEQLEQAEKPFMPLLPPVFLRSGKLVFPSGVRLFPGSSIQYNNQKYLIKRGPVEKKNWLLAGALVFILVLVLVVSRLSAPVPPKPVLFGIVVNSETREVLAGVDVSVVGSGNKAVTDELGTFRIEGLPNGRFDVKIEGELFETTTVPVTIRNGRSEFVSASLNPLIRRRTSTLQNTSTNDQKLTVSDSPQWGTLKIKCNQEDASILLDGKDLGVGNKTFRKIKPGSHDLIVRKDGYQDFSQTVEVEPGQTVEIAAMLDAVVQAAPTEYTASDFFEQAEALFTEGNYTEAIGYYTLALAKDHTMVETYMRRADANLLKGNKLNARSDFLAAADLYNDRGLYTKAVECYDKLIELAPQSAQSYQLRGWAKIHSGSYDGGLRDMETALSFDDKDYEARFEYGKALYITSNYRESEKQLNKIRKFGEEKPEIYGYLALACLAKGNEADARSNYQKFVNIASSAQVARISTESGWQRLSSLAGSGE